MKKITGLLFAVILFTACKKETIQKSNVGGMEVAAAVSQPKVISAGVYQSNIKTDTTIKGVEYFTYQHTHLTATLTPAGVNTYSVKIIFNGKSITGMQKRTYNGSAYTQVLSDPTGKTVYCTTTVSAAGVITNVVWGVEIPLNLILPDPEYRSWAACMRATIEGCAQFPLCGTVLCNHEAIVGCMTGWAWMCLWD